MTFRAFAAFALVACVLRPCGFAAEPRGLAEWKEIPDVTVLTHEGKSVQFARDLIGDKIAIVDFIYTDCTFICAPQGRTFVGLSELLGERLNREVVLISVSLAPERDTPAALTKWVDDLGGARPGWTLVTGDKREVRKLIRALAGFVSPQYHDGNAVILHAPSRTRLYFNGTEAPRRVLRQIEAIAAKQ